MHILIVIILQHPGDVAVISSSPNFMGLASLGLEIGIFCDFLYSVILLNVFLGLDFLGLALSRPQVLHRPGEGHPRLLPQLPPGDFRTAQCNFRTV